MGADAGDRRKKRPAHPTFGVPEIPLTREQATKRLNDIASAALLDLPTIVSPAETGLVLNVAAVGISPGTDGAQPYLRCADRTIHRLPEGLHEWALMIVAANQDQRRKGNPSLFPCDIEFGVLNGGAYAEFA